MRYTVKFKLNVRGLFQSLNWSLSNCNIVIIVLKSPSNMSRLPPGNPVSTTKYKMGLFISQNSFFPFNYEFISYNSDFFSELQDINSKLHDIVGYKLTILRQKCQNCKIKLDVNLKTELRDVNSELWEFISCNSDFFLTISWKKSER